MRLTVSPDALEVPPGTAVDLTVTLVNDGLEPLAATLTVTGIDPGLVALPDHLDVVAPQGAATAVVRVRMPDDTAPGDQRIGIGVSDQDGLQRDVVVTALVRVGARPDVTVSVEPTASQGRRSAEILTQLHNRGVAPIAVHLEAFAEGVDVRFLRDDLVLEPNEDVELPTRIERRERSWFREIRHGALIEVRGRGVPVTATATFVQRPTIPPLLLRAIALVTVLAVWAAAVIVVNDRIFDDTVHDKLLVASPALLDFLAAEAAAEAAGDGAGATGVDGEDAGADGPLIVVDGTVTGPVDPAGTEIVVEQVGFGDQGTTTGEGATLIAAGTSIINPVGAVLDRIETSTDEQGAFRISSGLQQPAYYRVTALRPGFEVGSRIVATSEDAPEATADIELVPADGGMTGRVTTAGGTPLGGADVTVTDGQLVFSATSATEGDTGTWSLSGLAAPASYQVIVERRGYATATLLVDLEGGQQLAGVDASLVGGLGTIRGRATSEGEGVGAVTVLLAGEGLERTTTTLTDGELAGGFDFPALPFGTYQLTFSRDGYLTQTTEVTVDRGDVEVLVSDLRRSTGSINGIVEQEVVPGGACLYPNPEVPSERDRVALEPCGGVGVAVVGADRQWRTTTATGDGTFQVSGLPAGEYLVRFERFGYTSQFFDLVIGAGDRLRVPMDVTASAAGTTDDSVSTASFPHGGRMLSAQTTEPTTVQMRLTPAVDAASSIVQGVIRDSTDPATPFAPPSGTRISVDGQVVDGLSDGDGVFRLEQVRAGAHTLRIEAPGYDVFTEVIQVPFAETADVGVLAITPLGSLALRITGGQASVVGGAEVFVTADPVAYEGTQRALPVLEAAGDVTSCVRTFALDGQTQTLEGLCATTDAVGDVEFIRSFGTGNYVLATPVNETDIADQPEWRATTVPLDHEQLVRRVDVESGQTVRLDPNLRRYPTVSGAIRAPSTIDEGLDEIDIANSDITFRRIDPQTGDPVDLPEGAPTPRISASADAGTSLGRGRYRIDRIPADDTQNLYVWQLIIETDVGIFERGPGQQEGFEAIDGLEFNDSETINAILQPPPVEMRFDVTYLNANGDPVPVDGALLRLMGTSSFQQLEVAPFFRPSSTVCPGPGCAVDDGFDFTTAAAPLVVADAEAERITPGNLWLSLGDDGLFTMPSFFRPGEIELELMADGFEPILGPVDEDDAGDEDAVFELRAPEPDASGTVVDDFFPVSLQLEVLPRDITGTVRLSPSATYPAFLANPELGGLTADTDVYADLDVRIYPEGDDPADAVPLSLSGTGSFTSSDRLPGTYELRVTGDHVETSVSTFEVAPGGSPYVVGAADSTATRRGVVRVLVEELELEGDGTTVISREALSGAEVELERLEAGTWTPVGPALTTCSAAGETGGGPACDDGIVTFDDLPILDADGAPWSYRIASTATGYIARDGAGEEFTLLVQPYAQKTIVQDRYGRLDGTVAGQIGTRPTTTLPSVTITLFDGDGNQVGTALASTDGTFAFGPDASISPADGPYTVTFTADGYFPEELTGLSFGFNTVVESDVVLAARPVTLLGVVRAPDGRQMYNSPALNLGVGVRVELFEDGVTAAVRSVETNDHADFTDTKGTTYPLGPGGYLVEGFDAGSYRVVYSPIPGTDGAEDFRSLERTIVLEPGDTLREDVVLPFAQAPLSGTVTTRAFERAPAETALTADDLGGVEVTATSDGTDPQMFTTQTAADGTYGFDLIAPGTYTVTFELDGYATVTRGAVLVVSPLNPSGGLPPTIVEETMLPAEVDVEVELVSSAGGAAVAGADVVANYLGPEASPGPDGSPFTATSGPDGVAVFSLPPGEWSFATVDTDVATFSPRPYVAGTLPSGGDAAPVVPLATDAVTTPVTYELTLDPYVRASGTAVISDGAGGLVPATGVAVSVVDDSGDLLDAPDALVEVVEVDAVGDTPASVDWTVWLPETPSAGAPRTAMFELTDYDDEPVEITAELFSDANPLDADLGAVELRRSARDVQVTLSSAAGNDTLAGIELVAELSGQPDVTATVVYDADNATATATFVGLKADATWTVRTVDAGSGGSVPHLAASGLELDVDASAGTAGQPQVVTGTFIDWAGAVTGTVEGEYHADESSPPALVGATVEVFQGTDVSSAPMVATTTDGNGEWTVGVLERDEGRARFSAPGYGTETDDYGRNGSSSRFDNDTDTATVDRTLTATPRDVEVAVASTATGTSVDGVSVSVAFDGSGGPTPPSPQVVDAGTVSFTLPPGEWLLSTTGGPGRSIPHVNETNVALSVPVDTAGSDAVFDADPVTLQRYASVSGVVSGREVSSEDDEPLAGVAITLDSVSGDATIVDTPTESDGAYRVWLADPATGTIEFTKTGYAVGEIDVAALVADGTTPLDPGVDVTQDVVVTATPRDVVATLTTTASGVNDGTFFEGVELTATRRGTATGVSATVVSSNAGGTATTTFSDLAPGTWDVTRGSGGDALNPDYLVDFTVVVEPGSGDVTANLGFKLIEGTLMGQNYAGAPSDERVGLAGVTLSLRQRVTPAPALAVITDADGNWAAGVAAGVVTSVTAPDQMNYQGTTDSITAGATLADVLLTAKPVPVVVTVMSDETDEAGNPLVSSPVAGAEVTAVPKAPADPAVFTPDDVMGVTSDGTAADETEGETTIELAPGGTWTVTASLDSTVTDSVEVVVDLGDGVANSALPVELTLTLDANSKLYGSVVEVRGNDRVAIPGVRVRAERPGDRYQTLSTEPDANGENYRLQARAGTWRISAVREGRTTVVDEAFEIRQDGPGSERNVLDIVLPIRSIDLAGRVVADTGTGVAGAMVTAVSSVGTVTTTSDAEGAYTLSGLDNRMTWAVTFTPPVGYDGRAVTRYVALSGELTAALSLDQTLPSGLGTIEVTVTGGEAGLDTEITLTEVGPFPTLSADGRLTRPVRLGADGTAVVEFEDLVPGDGRSLGQNRFGLEIRVAGRDPIGRSGLDVAPGGTTSVAIDLGMVELMSRQVALTLRDADGPVFDADVRLTKDVMVLGPPISPPDSDVYTFSDVEPGSWLVVADGFEDATIQVPEGADTFTATLELVAVPDPEEQTLEGESLTTGDASPDGTASDSAPDDASTAEGPLDSGVSGSEMPDGASEGDTAGGSNDGTTSTSDATTEPDTTGDGTNDGDTTTGPDATSDGTNDGDTATGPDTTGDGTASGDTDGGDTPTDPDATERRE